MADAGKARDYIHRYAAGVMDEEREAERFSVLARHPDPRPSIRLALEHREIVERVERSHPRAPEVIALAEELAEDKKRGLPTPHRVGKHLGISKTEAENILTIMQAAIQEREAAMSDTFAIAHNTDSVPLAALRKVAGEIVSRATLMALTVPRSHRDPCENDPTLTVAALIRARHLEPHDCPETAPPTLESIVDKVVADLSPDDAQRVIVECQVNAGLIKAKAPEVARIPEGAHGVAGMLWRRADHTSPAALSAVISMLAPLEAFHARDLAKSFMAKYNGAVDASLARLCVAFGHGVEGFPELKPMALAVAFKVEPDREGLELLRSLSKYQGARDRLDALMTEAMLR